MATPPTASDPSEAPTSSAARVAWRLAPFAGLAAAVVLGLGAVFPYSALLQRLIWPCPLKATLGVPCPTCGATRVAVLLARGHLLDALALAPLPALTLIGGLLLGGWATLARLRNAAPSGATAPEALARLLRGRAAWVAAAALLACLYGYTLWRHVHTGAP